MEVLLYQFAILFIIACSTIFGRRARNYVVIAILIFTVFQVFMFWLGVLQFFTVFIAYFISEGMLKKPKPSQPNYYGHTNQFQSPDRILDESEVKEILGDDYEYFKEKEYKKRSFGSDDLEDFKL